MILRLLALADRARLRRELPAEHPGGSPCTPLPDILGGGAVPRRTS
ncbi:hypothetical protein [Planomonospora venezuelensis]|uniref:Uncharacterized protein n=1 Tax=Planomonospora venezuelensis TaxID=1999 RepID=A0A841D9P6_PLAVE|nr:hypothetical protein [Planomonospora venezuelensis]MBB5966700.1 hypothetical protein [Planomonospora venezuelensis]